MDCPTCETMVDAYVDGELTASESAEFERALEACPQCRRRLEAARTMSGLLRELRSDVFREVDVTQIRGRLTLRKESVRGLDAFDGDFGDLRNRGLVDGDDGFNELPSQGLALPLFGFS